ncbi:hypothetical protein Bpfe_003395, partial [Biomphalaria pfeifferi]
MVLCEGLARSSVEVLHGLMWKSCKVLSGGSQARSSVKVLQGPQWWKSSKVLCGSFVMFSVKYLQGPLRKSCKVLY